MGKLKKYLTEIFIEASNKLPYLKDVKITFEIPKNELQGDLSSNAALLLSKNLKKPPRKIAEEILSSLVIDKNIIEKTEIAGPGFINFYFTPILIAQILKSILANPHSYGKSTGYIGKKANVEFVSANPTGPLTVGHGRNAVVGDPLANLLEWVGYDVDREYYFNNAGRQMRVLGDSVKQRYLELLGNKIDFPEDYYQGEYITEIAKKLVTEYSNKLVDEKPEGIFKEKAEQEIFVEIKKTLKRLGIIHKIF